jgi:hypothetical protein
MYSGYTGSGRPSVTSGPSGEEMEMSSTALLVSESTPVLGVLPTSINVPLSDPSTLATHTDPKVEVCGGGGIRGGQQTATTRVSPTCSSRP